MSSHASWGYKLSREALKSLQSESEDSDEQRHHEGLRRHQLPLMQEMSIQSLRPWHQSDLSSLVAGDASGSSHQRNSMMKEKLEHVKESLDQLVPPQTAVPPAFGNVLDSMASRLSSMEGMYSEVSGRLGRVDDRMINNERQVKELQTFQADTIHETDRIVQYIGSKAPSPSRPASLSTNNSQSPLHHLPTNSHHAPSSSSAGPGGQQQRQHHSASHGGGGSFTRQPHQIPQSPLEYVAGNVQVGATIQQHASQIHKLIAGLDFLEAHIIRQDQVIEGMQAAVAAGSRGSDLSSGRSPSEASVRLHDLSELVNKIRSHMYKVEKKTTGTEAGLQAAGVRLSQLAARLEALESRAAFLVLAAPHVPGLNGDVASGSMSASGINPLYSGVASEELSAQVAQLMRQLPVLVAENVELRAGAVRTAAVLEEIRVERVEEKAAAVSAGQELRSLRSQLFEAFDRIEATQALAQESAIVAASHRGAPLTVPTPDAATAATVEALQLAVAELTVQVTQLTAVAVEVPAVVVGLQQGQQRAEELHAGLEEVKAQSAAAEAAAAAAVLQCDSSGVSSSIARLAEVVQVQHLQVVEQVQALISDVREQQDQTATAMSAELLEKQEGVRQHVERLDMELSVQRVQLQQQVAAVGEEQAAWQEGFNGELRGRLDGLLERIRERLDGQIAQVTSQVSAHEQVLARVVTVESLSERLTGDGVFVQMTDRITTLVSEVDSLKVSAANAALLTDTLAELSTEVLGLAREVAKEEVTIVEAQLADFVQKVKDETLTRGEFIALSTEVAEGQDAIRSCIANHTMSLTEIAQSLSDSQTEIVKVAVLESMIEAAVLARAAVVDTELANLSEVQNHMGAAVSRIIEDVEALQASVLAVNTRASAASQEAEVQIRSLCALLEDTQAAHTLSSTTFTQQHSTLAEAHTAMELRLLPLTEGLEIVKDVQTGRGIVLNSMVAEIAGLTSAMEASGVSLGAVTEGVARLGEVKTAFEEFKAHVSCDYITREKLVHIFSAKDDMRRALAEITAVFERGDISRESVEAMQESLVQSGLNSPRLSSAMEDLATKQAELSTSVEALQASHALLQARMANLEEAGANQQSADAQQQVADRVAALARDLATHAAAAAVQQQICDGVAAAVCDVHEAQVQLQQRLAAAVAEATASAEVQAQTDVAVAELQASAERQLLAAAAIEADVSATSDVQQQAALLAEEMVGKQLNIDAVFKDLGAKQADMLQQIQQLLDGAESSVKQDQLISLQESILNLELIVTNASTAAVTDAPTEASADATATISASSDPSVINAHMDFLFQTLQSQLDALHSSTLTLQQQQVQLDATISQHTHVLEASPAIADVTELPCPDSPTAGLPGVGPLSPATAAAAAATLSQLETRLDSLEAELLARNATALLSPTREADDNDVSTSTPELAAATESDIARADEMASLQTNLSELRQAVQRLEASTASSTASVMTLLQTLPSTSPSPTYQHASDQASAHSQTTTTSGDSYASAQPGCLDEMLLSDASTAAVGGGCAATDGVLAAAAAATMVEQLFALRQGLSEVQEAVSSTAEQQYPLAQGLDEVREAIAALGARVLALSVVQESPPHEDSATTSTAAAITAELTTLAAQVTANSSSLSQLRSDLDSHTDTLSIHITTSSEAQAAAEGFAAGLSSGIDSIAADLRVLTAQVATNVEGLEQLQIAGYADREAAAGMASVGDVEAGSLRVEGLAGELALVAAQVAALLDLNNQTPAALQQLLDTHDAELASIKSQVQELVMTQAAEQAEWASAPPVEGSGVREGSVGVGETGHGLEDLAVVEVKTGAEFVKSAGISRGRVTATQDYVDSTHGMVKQLHSVTGSVLLRLAVVEGGMANVVAANNKPLDAEDVRQIQTDMKSVQAKFSAFEANNAEVLAALSSAAAISARLDGQDAHGAEMSAKIAAVGQTVPVLAGALKSLERGLHSKLDSAFSCLDSLGAALGDMAKQEAPKSKNPLKALGEAVKINNPMIAVLETRLETLRSAMQSSVGVFLDDLRTERRSRNDPPPSYMDSGNTPKAGASRNSSFSVSRY